MQIRNRLKPIETREFTQYLKNNYTHHLCGVEIGVLQGRNAYNMLKTLNIKKLYLVDPYIPYRDLDGSIYNPEHNFEIAKKKLKAFSDKIEFVKEKSDDAVSTIPADLDFVYIDSDHSFETTRDELVLYYPKVKKGGVIGGHDFMSGCFGVVYAVLDFVRENNLELKGACTDWWIVKNG